MFSHFDTIAAISTPTGNGGIGIVRISGDKTIEILEKIFRTNKEIKNIKSHTINYGHIVDGESIIDEVLVSLMLSPKTYTKEDIAEINCHGGYVSVSKVLSTVIKNGARIAEAGEFTKRAFLNGRIDLSQAEAVTDIINAKTSLSHEAGIKQLEGKLSKKIKEIRNDILTMIAHIEASIDYPEHDMEEINIKNIEQMTKQILIEIRKLIKSSESGKIIKNGIESAIIGKPNVGKSSLLNALLNEERAIVTDIPGTTRDAIEEYINIKNIPLKIIDTAGMRETKDTVEKLGIEKSKSYAKKADLILFIIDSSDYITDLDLDLLDELKDKKIIILLNKTDLPQKADITKLEHYKENIINISLKTNEGIENLFDKIEEMFLNNEILLSSELLVTSVRHKNALISCEQSLLKVINTIENGLTEDFLTIDLNDSYNFLGEIIGETLGEDIIDKIFSEFCLGK